MVIGGEYGVHEFAAETKTAAKSFVSLRLLITSEKRTGNLLAQERLGLGLF